MNTLGRAPLSRLSYGKVYDEALDMCVPVSRVSVCSLVCSLQLVSLSYSLYLRFTPEWALLVLSESCYLIQRKALARAFPAGLPPIASFECIQKKEPRKLHKAE